MSDYFEQVEQELRRALRRRAHLPWYARLRVRHPRALTALVACIVVGGPALAAALGLLNGQPSAPPTGTFTTPRADSATAATGYTFSVTPDLQGGGVGWCLTFHAFYRVGSSQGGGCYVPLAGRPIIAAGSGSDSTGSRSVTTTITSLDYLTTAQVAAVRVSPKLTILTRADPQLPDHYRLAIHIRETTGRAARSQPNPPYPFAAVPLDAAAHVIGRPLLPFGQRPSRAIPPHDATAYWQPGRTVGVGPQPKVHHAPAAACEINTAALHGSHLFFGWVVPHVHGFPNLASKTYLSCASTEFGYDHQGFTAAILLDAQHPGTTPEPLPGATPVPEHAQTFNDPAVTPPKDSHQLQSASQSITARRIGSAWLVVQASGTLTQRLAVLDRLEACVRLSGAPCPAPS